MNNVLVQCGKCKETHYEKDCVVDEDGHYWCNKCIEKMNSEQQSLRRWM